MSNGPYTRKPLQSEYELNIYPYKFNVLKNLIEENIKFCKEKNNSRNDNIDQNALMNTNNNVENNTAEYINIERNTENFNSLDNSREYARSPSPQFQDVSGTRHQFMESS